ncbi:MAG: 16S rRNA (adenine(1518)-N(6)/adenine(1519)-N(6))-dimethyltransferase RsmA [Myxococcota bacterium]
MIDPERIPDDLGTDPRGELRALEQRARKRFGQHFLRDVSVPARIVRAARVKPGDRVVEIGPGLGILTGVLLRAGADLTVVELDRDLAAHLGERIPGLPIVCADAQKVDWAALCSPGTKVVANLPYNVGTHLVMQLLRMPEVFASITVMLQQEVVQRLLAEPGTKAYGALTVEAAARAQGTFILRVDPGQFVPPPKVVSSVIRLDLREEPQFGGVAGDAFDRVVRAAFSQRRKTLLNSLGATFGRQRALAALEAAELDPQLRAERLSVEEFGRLAAQMGSPG